MQKYVEKLAAIQLNWVFVFLMVFFSCSENEEKSDPYMAINYRPLTTVTFKSTPERIKRGKYLAEGPFMCIYCHSERDESKPGHPIIPGREGAGTVHFEDEDNFLVAPNITPDVETGIEKLTDDMLARAIREGVGNDGRALAGMFWWTLKNMSDEDLASVIVYIRSIEPVENKMPKRNLGNDWGEGIIDNPIPITESVPLPD